MFLKIFEMNIWQLFAKSTPKHKTTPKPSLMAEPASHFTYDFTKDRKGLVIKGIAGVIGRNLVFPSEIEGYPVVELESLRGLISVQSIVIPESVKIIGENCFWSSFLSVETYLESVTIQGTGVTIGRSAFMDQRSLRSVIIKGTGVTVDHEAFKDCNHLKTLTFPDGDNVLIPKKGGFFQKISGKDAFSGCTKLPLAMRLRLEAMGFDMP